MWQVDSVVATDFCGYQDLSLDLRPLTGLTLILGHRGSGRSNGAGKSTLPMIISYALYGKLPKRLDPIEKIIRRGADGCVVKITLSDALGTVTITRKRSRKGGASMETSGFSTTALASGQQEAVDARFGDFDLFCATTMFAGDVSSFCRLPDSARKEMLERMSNVGHYAVAAVAAKDDSVRQQALVERYQAERAVHENRLEDELDRRARVAYESFKHALSVRRVFARMQDDVFVNADLSNEAFSKLAEWTTQAQAARVVAQRAVDAAEAKVTALESEVAALDARVTEVQANDVEYKTRIQVVIDERARIATGRHPDDCPTCGQRWPQDGDPDIVAKHTKEADDKLLDLRRKREPFAGKLRDLRMERDDLSTAIRDTRQRARDAAATVDMRTYRRLLADAIEVDSELQQRMHNLSVYAATHEDAADESDIDEADAAIAVTRSKLDLTNEVHAAAALAKEHADFWKKGFGRTGLPSYLIDAMIPAMTEVASEIANDLTDGELSLSFDPATEKGSKSVFSVKVDYAQGGDGFDSASRGEQTRVDMAVLFAIRDLAAKRSGTECRQLFLDEVMDGADEHFVDAFIRMLRNRYKDRSIILISHEPSAVSLCDRVLTARKKDGVSVLVPGA